MPPILRLILLTLCAALAGTTVATPALAIEAPYYRVGGSRLAGTQEVFAEAEGQQELTNNMTKIVVTCTGLKFSTGSSILGSSVGNPGTGEVHVEYSGCTVANNGVGCEVAAKSIKTAALKGELVYGIAKEPLVKGEKILNFFTPVTGSLIATIKFTGGACSFSSTAVEGSINFETLTATKLEVAFEENEIEEKWDFLKANSAEACKIAKSMFAKCKKPTLVAFGTPSTYEGTIKIKLPGEKLFGVFGK